MIDRAPRRHHRQRSTAALGALAALIATTVVAAPASATAATAGAPVVTPVTHTAQAPTADPAVDGARFATFTYHSTTAKVVTVTGSWGPSYVNVTSALSESSPGVFSATIGPLTPGAYSYSFTVDGVVTADPANPNTVHSTPGLTMFFVGGRSAQYLTAEHVRHGALTDLAYSSAVTGTVRHATVWTPPGYSTHHAGGYPTLYLFHGGGGDYLDWVEQGRANVILDDLYAEGRLAPMVVVMGDENVPGATGLPEDDQFVPELTKNLLPAVQKAYAVSHQASTRALAGLSLGGLNVFNTVLEDPGAFPYVGDFSSGYFPAVIAQLKSQDSALLKNPAVDAKTRMLRIYVGDEADIAYQNNILTRKLFDQYGIHYQFAGSYPLADHDWKTWSYDLHDFAPRLFHR